MKEFVVSSNLYGDLDSERTNQSQKGEKVSSDIDLRHDERTAAQRRRTALLIVAIVLAVLLLCAVACVIVVLSGTWTAMKDKASLTPVLDQFLKAMSAKDVDQAYSLFSSRAQSQVPPAELVGWVEGTSFEAFQGYESLRLEQVNISRVVDSDSRNPQGTVARVTGVVTYSSGPERYFQATLEKEEGDWRLDFFHIVLD